MDITLSLKIKITFDGNNTHLGICGRWQKRSRTDNKGIDVCIDADVSHGMDSVCDTHLWVASNCDSGMVRLCNMDSYRRNHWHKTASRAINRKGNSRIDFSDNHTRNHYRGDICCVYSNDARTGFGTGTHDKTMNRRHLVLLFLKMSLSSHPPYVFPYPGSKPLITFLSALKPELRRK